MFQYVVGYGSPEDSWYWHIWHETQYTDGELAVFVEDALLAALKAEKKARVDMGYEHRYNPSFDDLMTASAFKEVMKDMGFFEKAVESVFDTFGWASAIDPEDWASWRDDEGKDLSKRLAKRLEDD